MAELIERVNERLAEAGIKAATNAKESLVWNLPELAPLLKVSKATIYNLAAQGVIPTIRLGKRLVVPKAAFERWLAEAGQAK